MTSAQNFIPKLEDHTLARLRQGDDGAAYSFSNEERAKLIILRRNSIFTTVTINYMTYDGRRESETLDPKTHADIMTLSQNDVHPYEYFRNLGTCRVKVLHPCLGRKIQAVDLLWVRSYEFDEGYQPGWKARRFYRVRFTSNTRGDPFGFLDPQDVLRATHLAPGPQYGRTQSLLPLSLAQQKSEGDGDWMYYHVNMFMRYRGGWISHGYMQKIESRFEEMRREQNDLEGHYRLHNPSRMQVKVQGCTQ